MLKDLGTKKKDKNGTTTFYIKRTHIFKTDKVDHMLFALHEGYHDINRF